MKFSWMWLIPILIKLKDEHNLNASNVNKQCTLLPTYTCGQYYKASMIVIYDTRVVPDLKIPHITTLKS